MGKSFKFNVFTVLESALNLFIFTYAPVSHSKLQADFFESLFRKSAVLSLLTLLCNHGNLTLKLHQKK